MDRSNQIPGEYLEQCKLICKVKRGTNLNEEICNAKQHFFHPLFTKSAL